ncbi:glycine-rich domain-containing protein [Parasedimentitalea psychrophila]|uniref:Uncharacterized protein n=1 Tax=Parasedimentitalea psychrophila TaxID=2997337 RepID=A0A9Y2KUV2_9RHOB|nr:hypothetical protein [Parasedimentitalea psychrophila]WIY23570.1 hypothetical protein QPJ95_12980 [Parasedimentitalea psychrophila]
MTHLSRPELWAKIEAYEFPNFAGGLSFRDLVRKETKFSASKIEQAILEYRRFAYLSQVSDVSVVPSSEVDAIWHVHLTLTRDYWQRFCDGVLGQKLHHTPESGAVQSNNGYSKTLDLYELEFGEPTPRNIWPRKRQDVSGLVWFAGAVVSLMISWATRDPIFFFLALVLGAMFVLAILPSQGLSKGAECSGGTCHSCSSCGGD